MNKKVLILGLSSIMLLASCGSDSTNLVLRKDVNFNPDSIVNDYNEIALIKEQVKQGFNLLKNVKVTNKQVFHGYDSANHEEIMTVENVSKVDFFSNGSAESSETTTKHSNSVISKTTANRKEAVADSKFISTVSTSRVFPSFWKESLTGDSKELALYTTRRNYGETYFLIDNFFPTGSSTADHNIVARLSKTKIAAYNEVKVVYVFNPQGSSEPTFTQIESGYNYLEANLKGDTYVISKIEAAYQVVGNFYGDPKTTYIKLDSLYKLQESSFSFEYSYNNEQSNYKDSADLSNLLSNFPAWSTTSATLNVSTYSPNKDETGKIISVEPVSYPSTNISTYCKAHDDLHGFDVKLNGASPEYLYTFHIHTTIDDHHNISVSPAFNDQLNLTGGLTPAFTDDQGMCYYSLGELGKIYTFNVGLAYDAATTTLTVPTFTVA